MPIYGIQFVCEGEVKGWLAESAQEAHKVIDVLDGKLDPSVFLAWILENVPHWADAATSMVNACAGSI